MRNLKRFLAMALTVLMVVGSFSAMSVSAFEDVTDYQEAIDVMAALGILKGTDEEADLFSPEENIARWQMALIITKMMTGKVDAAYVEANFNTAINSTLYTDLNEGQYMGATAYAANNGIVVGTSATTFEPEESIMIQDVFTMVVRMLGYGSTAMNANYPWSFIDKAISLGLDAGLPADYANEKAATRGETAQILYNALTAVKADGSTLGYDFFGLEKATVIITGTKAGNMFNSKAAVVTKTVDGVDQVAFAVLNADGTLGATTYYAPKTAFGIEGNANAYVGYPFVVRTNDAFASFLTVDPIEAVALDQDAVVGATADAGKGKITLDGQEYVLAETYSDFIKDNSVEIILNQVGTYANTFDYGSYVMDEALNIMGKDGKVLLKWIQIGNPGGNSFQNGTYLYEVAEGKFIVPNDAIWAQAATYTTGTEAYGFKAIMDSKALEAKDAYSDTVVFDIDGDGDYDRGIYTNYSLTKIADGKNIDTATTTSALTFVTADGEAAKFADYNGKYVLYAYNDLYNTVIIKTAFETNTALVTGADLAANKITFNGFGLDFLGAVVGETYAYGNAKLPGAVVITDATGAYFAEIIGKNAVYIEDNGVVLAIEQFASAAEYMVVTNVNTGYTTMGYPQIMGYTSTAAVKDIITLNAVNNYWYAQIDAKVYTEGTLVALTKDALGYYDVKVKADNYTAAADAKINVKNGIVSAENITNFPTFAATADLVWIVRNEANKYETYIGIPASGAYIDVDADSIFYDATAKFIYVNGGKFAGNAAGGNAWGTAPVQSTIVYLDAAALATRVETNVIGNVNIFGTVSTYSNAIDMINGGYVNVSYTDYNFNRLTKGFYKVEGGRIVGAADDLVGTALLADADRLTKWTYSWIPEYESAKTYYTDNLVTVNSVLPTLYTEGTGVTDQLAKTDTAAYKALNDATTDGNDAIVVYYAKAMFADSKPIFLAKDITVDATIKARPVEVVPTTYAVVFGGVETAIENGNGTFKFFYEADETIAVWAVVNKDFEFVAFEEIGFNRYAVAVTADMFYADTENKYDADKVLELSIDALFAEEDPWEDRIADLVAAIEDLTDLTTTELAAIKDVLFAGNTMNEAKLNAIVAAIKASDDATVAELQKIITAIQESDDATVAAMKNLIDFMNNNAAANNAKLDKIIEAIAASDDATVAAIGNLIDYMNIYADNNAKLIEGITAAIAKGDDDLIAKIDAIVALAKEAADAVAVFATNALTEILGKLADIAANDPVDEGEIIDEFKALFGDLVGKLDEMMAEDDFNEEAINSALESALDDAVAAIAGAIKDNAFNADSLKGIFEELMGAIADLKPEEKTYTVELYVEKEELVGLFTTADGQAINVVGSEETATIENTKETAFAIKLADEYTLGDGLYPAEVYQSVVVPYVGGSSEIRFPAFDNLEGDNTFGVGLPIVDGITIIDALESFADEDGVVKIVIDVERDLYKKVALTFVNEYNVDGAYSITANGTTTNKGDFANDIIEVPVNGNVVVKASVEKNAAKLSANVDNATVRDFGEDITQITVTVDSTMEEVVITVDKLYPVNVTVKVATDTAASGKPNLGFYYGIYADSETTERLSVSRDMNGTSTTLLGYLTAAEIAEEEISVYLRISYYYADADEQPSLDVEKGEKGEKEFFFNNYVVYQINLVDGEAEVTIVPAE